MMPLAVRVLQAQSRIRKTRYVLPALLVTTRAWQLQIASCVPRVRYPRLAHRCALIAVLVRLRTLMGLHASTALLARLLL